jgi:hypothetical protein
MDFSELVFEAMGRFVDGLIADCSTPGRKRPEGPILSAQAEGGLKGRFHQPRPKAA